MGRPRALSPALELDLVRRYRHKESTHNLAGLFQISVQSVCNVLRRNGVDLRRRGKPARKPKQGKPPSFEIVSVPQETVEAMCVAHHAYGSGGKFCTYAFAVIEDGRPVACFAWQPPTLGTARAVCPEAPHGVLALSRMVAVPKAERKLRHISKPLRKQMLALIDRTRWPVLVTYSDEGQGHTGHVYKCSGWQQVATTKRPFYADASGNRFSAYYGGERRLIKPSGTTTLRRWVHRVCAEGAALQWMKTHGWQQAAIPNRVWRSGNQAFTWVRDIHQLTK